MHQKDIIAASVILGFGFLSAMVLVTRFLWVHKYAKDGAHAREYSVDAEEQTPSTNLFTMDRSWRRMFIRKQDRGQWVPTLSGVIKAGDEGVYSSALLNGLHAYPGELNLDMLYDAFANELRARPTAERSKFSPAISKFLTSARRGVRRAQSVSIKRDSRPDLPPRPQRNSIDLAERGLGRSRSRRTSPVLISNFNLLPSETDSPAASSHTSWTNDLQHAQYFEGRTGVMVTPKELAALSVFLGSPITITEASNAGEKPEDTRLAKGRGAFGISINATPTGDGKYRILLRQHKRSIPQLPARGSGYSTLFAKHLASGSIPFLLDKNHVNAILITSETFKAIQSGTRLHLQKSAPVTQASHFLTSLSNSRDLSFHTLAPSTSSTSMPLLLHAIAAMPFSGGFAPLASAPLVQAVRFVASGGLPPARLLQRLEALVDKVHRYSPGLQLFGPLYEDIHAGLLFRERERLGRLATGAKADDSIADKVARMQRYITLLERLMCLVPDMKPHDVLCAVREAMKKEIERSYEDAVATFKNGAETPDSALHTPQKRLSLSNRTRGSKRWSLASTPTPPAGSTAASPSHTRSVSSPGTPTSVNSPRSSFTFPAENLGKQVEQVLKVNLPFNIETVALVARMVLVAWTLSVETVAWEDGEEGIRLPELSRLPEKMVMW